MGGQINKTRLFQRVGIGMGFNSLKGVFAAQRIALIDDQTRATMVGNPAPDIFRDRLGGGVELDDLPLFRVGKAVLKGRDCAFRAKAPMQRPVFCANQTLAPSVPTALELPNGQGIEELVGDKEQRAFGQIGDG